MKCFGKRKKPTKRIVENAIVLNEWENEAMVGSEKIFFKNITIRRLYFDKKIQNFKSTDSFNPKDLPNIIKIIKNYYGDNMLGDDIAN